jgi:hypothetical protein
LINIEGEVPGAAVPHIGNLEMKVLQGCDNENYLLEVLRITPRDANYVQVFILSVLL